MGATGFIERQLTQIRQGGRVVLFKKLEKASGILHKLPLIILASPFVLAIRLAKPWLLVRLCGLVSVRIGHFAANTELTLCEQDAGINMPKKQRSLDFFYMAYRPICNHQLATMWRRNLRVWPTWLLDPIARLNRLIPGGAVHDIGNNTQHDRDVHNLLDRFPPHLQFTVSEESRGEAGLRRIGIPVGSPFVCLIVRDSAYLESHQSGNWDYHNYRDSNIQNYVQAAEELANRG